LRINQDFVGFLDLLKFVFAPLSLGFVLYPVRVEFQGQLPMGRTDSGSVSIFGDPQGFVGVCG
jgi:hypothetical protein